MTKAFRQEARFRSEATSIWPQAGVPRLIAAFILWLALAVMASLSLPAKAWAQEAPVQISELDNWQSTALRAEQAIDSKRASSAAFEQLRGDLTAFRQEFQAEKSKNEQRIRTLEGQLAALGAAPTDGATEPADIAQLRNHLTIQLNQLRVPRIIAEEAFSRADGLIGEVDSIIRERRTKHLLERGPSPLNPALWPDAIAALSWAGRTVWLETRSQIVSDTTAERIWGNLPEILFLVLLGSLLVLRGRPWAHRMGEYLRGLGARGTGVWTFIVSLLQVILPLFGIIALTAALDVTGILGVRGTLMLDHLPGWALILLSFHWLGDQLFKANREVSLMPMAVQRRGEAKLMVDLWAVILVTQDVLLQLYQLENTARDTQAVLSFPLILAAALVLYRLNRLGVARRGLAQVGQATAEAEGREPEQERRITIGANRLFEVVRRGAFLLGYLAPVLAAVGYVNAAEALIYPAIMTLLLLAALFVLQRFAGDLFGFLSGQGEAARDSLVLVGVGFVLSLLSLPLMALIWGARVADLTELWSKFLAGFSIGETQISPVAFLSFVVIFAIGYGLTRVVQSTLRTSFLPKTNIDPGGQNAIVSGLGYVGVFLAALVAISMAGLDLSSLAIVAGALSVGIGFGLQTIVSNFVSGIILLVERPISKGDWIEVGGLMGYVRDISVRSTRIETFDRSDVIVPNSDLITGTVTNYTRGNTVGRVIVPVGVAYGTDPRRVEAILNEIAQSHPMVLLKPAPSVIFQGFGADSLDFEIRAILRDVNWVLSVKSDLNYEIAARFAAEEIEIPFAQRDLWIRNPEALVPGQSAEHRAGETEQARSGSKAEEAVAMARPDLEDLQISDEGGDSDADR
jgi:small-conductance mechanosensitive channel